jgi:predicted methyltransferase
MALGLYEPDVAWFIYRLLRPGDVFYDIGANAGYFSLIAAKVIGSSGQVIAFDPVPKNAMTVREQVGLNGLGSRCRVESLAISDTDGAATFLVTRRNPMLTWQMCGHPTWSIGIEER